LKLINQLFPFRVILAGVYFLHLGLPTQKEMLTIRHQVKPTHRKIYKARYLVEIPTYQSCSLSYSCM